MFQRRTGYELLGELEDEFQEEAMELEPVFPPSAMKALRSGSAEHELLGFPEFEDTAAIAARKLSQKKLLDFRVKYRLRPQDFRKLILTARLHPFPRRSSVIALFPVPNNRELLPLVLDGFLGSTEPGESSQEVYDQILAELYRLADRKFAREIAAEIKLAVGAADVIAHHLDKLKPVLLQAAKLNTQTSQKKLEELSDDFHKLGLRLAGELGVALQSILDSEVNEAHLTWLGWRFAQKANTLKKQEQERRKRRVEQERRRRRP
jgi:hypothetical protein